MALHLLSNVCMRLGLLSALVGCLMLNAQIRGVFVQRKPGTVEDIPADAILDSGHGARITALVFSPHDSLLASASEDNTVRLWEAHTGRQRACLRGHTAPVRTIAFSADGALLASGGDDRTIRIWDVASGTLRATWKETEPIIVAAFNPDASRVVAATRAGTLRLWDVASGRQIRTLEEHAYPTAAAFFSSDDATVLVASQYGDMDIRGDVKVFNAESGQLLETRAGVLKAVATHGSWMAVQQRGSPDLQIFEEGASGPRGTLTGTGQFGPIAFSPQGDWIAYSVNPYNAIAVQRSGGSNAGGIRGENWEFETLALSPDGALLAIAARAPVIKLWNPQDGKLVHTLSPQFNIGALAFSPDGKRLASGGLGDGTGALRIWDLASGAEVPAPAVSHAIIGAAFSPDGSILALSSRNLELWDLSGKLLKKIQSDSDIVMPPVFSPNGKLIAASQRGVVSIWDVRTATSLQRFGARDLTNTGVVAFSPNGRLVAAAAPLSVVLYDLLTGTTRMLALPGQVSAIAFTPDSRRLAIGTRAQIRATPELGPVPGQNGSILTWDLDLGRQIWSTRAGYAVSALAFTEGGKSILAVSGEWEQPAHVVLYDSGNGQALRTVVEKVDPNSAAVFSPDQAWVAVGPSGAIGVVKLWNLRH